jgi:hypothetical protein
MTKSSVNLGFDCWKKIIQKTVWIAISFERYGPDRAVPVACG